MNDNKTDNKKSSSKKCKCCTESCTDEHNEINYKDLYIQTLANYQNLQKRIAKDIKRTHISVRRDIISEFINVYDAAKTGAKYNEQGPVLIFNAFKKSLQNLNITIIDNDFLNNHKISKFDDSYFDAVIKTQTDDETLDGHINEIITDGFFDDLLQETLVHAKVSVYSYCQTDKK